MQQSPSPQPPRQHKRPPPRNHSPIHTWRTTNTPFRPQQRRKHHHAQRNPRTISQPLFNLPQQKKNRSLKRHQLHQRTLRLSPNNRSPNKPHPRRRPLNIRSHPIKKKGGGSLPLAPKVLPLSVAKRFFATPSFAYRLDTKQNACKNRRGESMSKNTIAQRFAETRNKTGLSKKAFAESLGIHPVVAGDIELGKREPSRQVLLRLAHLWNVDLNWLLTGTSQTPSANTTINESPDLVYVDFFNQGVAAGRGTDIDPSAETIRYPVSRSFLGSSKPDQVRALQVRGDSMIGAGLHDTDIVFFNLWQPSFVLTEGIYVISIENLLLVKRLHWDRPRATVKVISENPQYPPRFLQGQDLENLTIEGRVFAWLHREE